ncbi:MAG: hypothetical protein JO224_04680 [Pelomonas sp.]|nr:hypothetical protein [Roseateles sp.]
MAKTSPLLIGALVLAAALGGCGTPSQSLGMNITTGDALQLRTWVPDALKFNVELDHVKGGDATSRWWGSRVSGMALEQALEDSLRSVGMLPVAPASPARYQLRCEIVALVQPVVAADTTVTVTIHYELLQKSDGKLLYQRDVRTRATTDFTDAMLSQPERMRRSNESAVRQNIVTALRDLMALRVEAPTPI